jgi:UDP-galactopyranose mutase
MVDYVIVGAGLFGSVMARELTDAGYSCIVVEKRNYIGGNCATMSAEGIEVHLHGPHIFHTNSEPVWKYIKRFTEFNNYRHTGKAMTQSGKLVSIPVNLSTIQAVFDLPTIRPEEAQSIINKDIQKVKIPDKDRFDYNLIRRVGPTLYEEIYRHYTEKQWGREAKDVPAFIGLRLPIRFNFDDNYFHHVKQGIPLEGYNKMFENLLQGIEVHLGVNYLQNKEKYKAKKLVIFTGPIDAYYDYKYGELEYRSLQFHTEVAKKVDRFGTSIINNSNNRVNSTRLVEHKHFHPETAYKIPITICTSEYPQEYNKDLNDPYYPINDEKNNKLYEKYSKEIPKVPTLFGGRLAEYRYYDMDQTIESALEQAHLIISKN